MSCKCGGHSAAECGCKGGRTMSEKVAKPELIAALVTDKFSWFKDGDEKSLDVFGETRLDDFRVMAENTAAAASEKMRVDAELRNANARIKVLEEKIKASEQPMTDEEFIQRAPASIKKVLEERQAEENMTRAAIIGQLKNLGAETEEELKAKSTDDLRKLARYAGLNTKALDFSGRGAPVNRSASAEEMSYAAPDTYGAGLAKLRAQEKF